jgi:transcriptional regulator with XRE-family HTH domain
MKDRGVKQIPLSKATHISQAALSYYCRGDRAPSAEHLCELAEFFGISMDALWGREPLQLPNSTTSDRDAEVLAAAMEEERSEKSHVKQ